MPARAADKARITGLSDVAFGLITGTADQAISESVCAYSSSSTGGYSVTATGDGSGGAFELSAGADQLAYDVLWTDSADQAGGTALVAGSATAGFTSVANQQFCNSGPSTSASLTVVIRSASLGSAMVGSYAGTLQITIAPE
jgi:hypothetical protein